MRILSQIFQFGGSSEPTSTDQVGDIVKINSLTEILIRNNNTYLRSGIIVNQTDFPNFPTTILGSPTVTDIYESAVLPASSNAWRDMVYGNGLYVVVGDGDPNYYYLTSSDLINWTTGTIPVSGKKIAYGNGLFVTISESTAYATSPDGITWTERTLPLLRSWKSIAYGNGLFVIIGNDESNFSTTDYLTSPDGITWTERTLPAARGWAVIKYLNGIFLAAATVSQFVHTSVDGITWSAAISTVYQANWGFIAYGNGLYIMVAEGYIFKIITSPDGITWTERPISISFSWQQTQTFVYGDGYFVLADAERYLYSTDGINWTSLDYNPPTSSPSYASIYDPESNIFYRPTGNSVRKLIQNTIGIPTYTPYEYLRVE